LTFPAFASSRFGCFAGERFFPGFFVVCAASALESLTRLAPVEVPDSGTLTTSFGVAPAALTADIANPPNDETTKTKQCHLQNAVRMKWF